MIVSIVHPAMTQTKTLEMRNQYPRSPHFWLPHNALLMRAFHLPGYLVCLA